MAGRDVTGLAKHLPQRRWQGWPQKGMQIYPQEALFKCRRRPSLPEESKRNVPDTGKERETGQGMQQRSSPGRERGGKRPLLQKETEAGRVEEDTIIDGQSPKDVIMGIEAKFQKGLQE